MRIRKNAKKLSPVLFSAMESVPEVLQTHVCQLNQSPWDVIPLHHQHATNQLQDTFNDNASLADSFPAVESVASMEESEKLSSSYIVVSNESEVMAEEDGDYCEDLDENGDGFVKLVDNSWKCKKQFEEEDYSSFSPDHHHHHHRRPSLLRSTEINYYSSITKKSAAGGMVSRRTRPARASKKSVSAAAATAAGGSNPYEFYYYSGFGPLWGKKRRDRGGEDGGRSSENTTGNRSNGTTPSEIDGDELDYVDDDDEEEEENDGDGDGGKKRMRKPVKARSLKSLM